MNSGHVRGESLMPSSCSRGSCRGSNALAACVIAGSLIVLYASFDPVPAGEDLHDGEQPVATATAFEIVDINETVPVPPDATVVPQANETNTAVETAADPASADSTVQIVQTPESGIVLDNNEAIKFSLLVLKDGATWLQGVQHYSTLFSKQERIEGDLTENQIIEMKVQHGPTFGVYMKWKNSDTGRQLLYNEEYEDRQLVVKLGGLKGRLLPAIKLDPRGDRAMSEARYPVTEAGILGMMKQIISHRELDLKRGHGCICRRLPNQVFDEKNCMCFVFEYESPEISKTYRKSIILIDARHNIPLMARNFTWAREADGLSAQELDDQTLIENYSFTAVNFAVELVAEDFSRDNPRYRM